MPRGPSGRPRSPSSATPPALTRTARSAPASLVPGSTAPGLDGEGLRLGDLARIPPGRPLERLDGPRLVDVHDGVELIGQQRVEVVARALGVGTVDDADGPFEAGSAQCPCRRVAVG